MLWKTCSFILRLQNESSAGYLWLFRWRGFCVDGIGYAFHFIVLRKLRPLPRWNCTGKINSYRSLGYAHSRKDYCVYLPGIHGSLFLFIPEIKTVLFGEDEVVHEKEEDEEEQGESKLQMGLWMGEKNFYGCFAIRKKKPTFAAL